MADIIILGVFVADVAFRAKRQPAIGETLIGEDFKLGPGGKGSNQAVAAARLGADVALLTRLGDDTFASIANDLWDERGVETGMVMTDPNHPTGAAYIFIDTQSGENAIIVVPGAGMKVSREDIDSFKNEISTASIFMAQLETSQDTTFYGLKLAKERNVTTILNPAPAVPIPDEMISFCDYLIPNETEATALTGIEINNKSDASRAARMLIQRGAGTVIITLGGDGAYFDDGQVSQHIEPVHYGKVVDTTGAGDSFCGSFAQALSRKFDAIEAVRYASVAASISVTRFGTALSMPDRGEVDDYFNQL